MSNQTPNQDVERAALLGELVKMTGRDDMPALMSRETIETIRANLESRRQAEADIRRNGRLGAIWNDDRAVVEDRVSRRPTAFRLIQDNPG